MWVTRPYRVPNYRKLWLPRVTAGLTACTKTAGRYDPPALATTHTAAHGYGRSQELPLLRSLRRRRSKWKWAEERGVIDEDERRGSRGSAAPALPTMGVIHTAALKAPSKMLWRLFRCYIENRTRPSCSDRCGAHSPTGTPPGPVPLPPRRLNNDGTNPDILGLEDVSSSHRKHGTAIAHKRENGLKDDNEGDDEDDGDSSGEEDNG
ncbi:hypothetical protein THAOC_17001 [Thalassiosira oceanica]|uniref:Uncharacterized protein n=1 Tax=Thalassiosira oceanica TaxID=159749 RepID=K0SBR5_THAOC|nr:hypothetical protein THAOC_17001 [Thalassiosira oceanica]|eukprot:EJK62389.1 hypothetical protein THAOC_17001 [Thalassiosira oceanica]